MEASLVLLATMRVTTTVGMISAVTYIGHSSPDTALIAISKKYITV